MHFNEQSLWSTNNANTNGDPQFKGTGIYLNSLDESFSLGSSLWFNDGGGHLGNLAVEDVLTMGTAGNITNSAGDFSITDEGFSMAVPNDTLDLTTSVVWESGGSAVAQIGAAHDTSANFDFLEYSAGYHDFKVDGNTIFSIQDNLVFPRKPLVLPRLTNAEKNNLTVPTGAVIFNTDIDSLQFKDGSGNWRTVFTQ